MRFPSLPLISITLSLALAAGCDEETAKEATASSPVAKNKSHLPTPGFTVKPKMASALFTWVDKDGSFQIADKPEAVPEHAQKTVRVVVEGHSPGGPEHVFVVDLSALSNGGELPVRAISRTEWEILGKKQRDERIAKLAPPEEPDAPSPSDLGVNAIVYGAEWCKPCHLAEDYLKKKGARVVKKDIEEDPSAASEMRQKLKAAGLSGSSIPIIDVGGTILRGFSEGAIDAALKHASASP